MANPSADLVALLHAGDHPDCTCVCCRAARELEQLRLDLAQQTANAKTVIDLQNEVERLNKKCSALALLQYGPPKLPPHITQQQAIDAYEWLRNQRSPQADIALELWGRAARHPDDVGDKP